MNDSLRVLGVVGSPTAGGKTDATVRLVVGGACSRHGVDGDVVLLDGTALETPDSRRAEERAGATRELLDAFERADMVVLGTPVHRATFSSSLKQCLDLVPRGGYDGDTAPLRAKPVVVVATGSLPQHFLATDALVGILVNFFAAWVVPPAVYAHAADFDKTGRVTGESPLRAAAMAATTLVALAEARRQAPDLSLPEPQL
jgi:FMN reductase